MIEAQRGEVITSELKLMERWRWSKSKVRRFIKGLADERMVIKKADSKKTSLSIVNWETYQESETIKEPQEDRRKTADDTQSRMNKNEKKKDPSEISSEISSLISKVFPFPGGEETYSKMIQAISQTRKGGKISPGIILSLLKSLERHSQEKIRAGIQIYLEKAYHTQGKGEKYLLGIIRNHRPGETPLPQEFKSTGSATLDAYYRKQLEKGTL
jgi:hypothetical protein